MLVVASALLGAWPVVADAQRVTIHGVVRDSSGNPVPLVDVSIPARRTLVQSDSAGVFVMRNVQAGEVRLHARRLGYAPAARDVRLLETQRDTILIVLAETPQLIAGMQISDMRRRIALEDFYRRRAQGGGIYFTREDIDARNPSKLTDILRNSPGLHMVLTPNGLSYVLRFVSASRSRRDCPPQFWLDGQRLNGFEIDDIPPKDVEGIELYQGPSTTPSQFSSGWNTSCGTVVVWSRVPNT